MSETRLRGPISFSSGFRGDSFTTAGAGISDRKAVPYPSPFFDIAHTYLPYTIKGLFRYCRYYFLTNPLIFAVASKMSEYPVTDLVYQSEEEELRRRYQRLFEDVLDIKMTQIECGLDLNVYGNCFLSIRFPFIKYLKCQHCGGQFKASESRYRFVGLKFRLSCPACGHDGDAIAKDVYIKSISDIRLVRWNPEYVDVEGNELTKDFSYYLHIPPQTKNDILLGKREVIENVEQPFIEAVRLQKAVKFYGEGIHHLRRPSITWKDSCYGIPLLLPVLKDTFYLQILRKAQEAIVSQHIVPLRILFPQPGTETSDPMRMTKLPTWVGRIEDEIAKWRRDCVSPNTLIETERGLLRAEDISVGDLLKNHEGGSSEVAKIWRRPLRDGEKAFKVVARGLHAVGSVFSEGHPLLVARKQNNGNGHKLGEAGFVRVGKLQVGDYIGYPTQRKIVERASLDLAEFVDRAATEQFIYVDHHSDEVPRVFEFLSGGGDTSSRSYLLEELGCSLNQYKTAQAAVREQRTLRRLPRYIPFDRELAWVVGLYLAEGNCSPKQVLFSLHAEEREFVGRLNCFFSMHFGCAPALIREQSESGIQLVFSSLIAAEFFSELCPGVSRMKRVPQIYREAEQKIVLALLQGLFDGDGCAHQDGYSHKSTFCSSGRQLSEDIRALLLSLGVPAGITYTPPQPYTICEKTGLSSGCYRLGIFGSAVDRLQALTEDQAEVPQVRDCRMGVFRDGYFWSRVEEIHQVEAAEVIGFQMKKDASVVRLEDDTETHGTFCTWGMAGANSNYIPVLPLPIGQEMIGGDGKALLLFQEQKILADQIIAGMGVPQEFIYGGLSYAGSSVSMRMLENQFISYRSKMLRILRIVANRIAAYMEWPSIDLDFTPFRMADDLQRTSLHFQLNQANRLSSRTMLEIAGFDYDEEMRQLEEEKKKERGLMEADQLSQATIQGKAQAIAMGFQMKAQQSAEQSAMAAGWAPLGAGPAGGGDPNAMAAGADPSQMGGDPSAMASGDPSMAAKQATQGGAPDGTTLYPENGQPEMPSDMSSPIGGAATPGIDVNYVAMRVANEISQEPPDQQRKSLNQLQQRFPSLYELVVQLMENSTGSQQDPMDATEMPMPEQRAPRRQGGI